MYRRTTQSYLFSQRLHLHTYIHLHLALVKKSKVRAINLTSTPKKKQLKKKAC